MHQPEWRLYYLSKTFVPARTIEKHRPQFDKNYLFYLHFLFAVQVLIKKSKSLVFLDSEELQPRWILLQIGKSVISQFQNQFLSLVIECFRENPEQVIIETIAILENRKATELTKLPENIYEVESIK